MRVVESTKSHGEITELLDGYGFIETPQGHRLTFHRDSCEHVAFETLAVGDQVVFELDTGPDGPLAQRVVLRKHSLR